MRRSISMLLCKIWDEDIRRQTERWEQVFTSDITVAQNSGGFVREPESAELAGHEEQKRWELSRSRRRMWLKLQAVGVIRGKNAKRARTRKSKKGTDKK